MATLAELEAALVNADRAGDAQAARAFASEISRLRSSQPKTGADLKRIATEAGEAVNPTAEMGGGEIFLAGMGKAVADAGRGLKQRVGLMSPQEVQASRAVDAPLMETGAGKVGNFAGNMAMFAPTAMIPGANTLTGSALAGAVMGAVQPTTEGESALMNTALGAGAGMAGKVIGDKVAGMVTRKEADEVARQGRNALKDRVLQQSQDAGYVLPKSEVSPTFLSNRLESLAGKAALKQDATLRNQEVTNSLARKVLGLGDDEGVSDAAIAAFRNAKSQPYREVAALDPRAAQALERLKQARADAKVQWNFYNRSGNPEAMAKAKSLDAAASLYESVIEKAANRAGKPELAQSLKDARRELAKSFDLERAMNPATGDIDAKVLGRLLDKGKPLSNELLQIAEFAKAYPKFSGAGATAPAPGVGKTERLASALLGTAGGTAMGPAGMAAAVLPFLAQPTRAALLSQPFQRSLVQPSYGIGAGSALARKLAPQFPVAAANGALIQVGE